MSTDTDNAMFGRPLPALDFLRQRRRTVYRLASSLEGCQRLVEQLQIDFCNPNGPQATPQQYNDLFRVFLILSKLITWCWEGAFASEALHATLDASVTNALNVPPSKAGGTE